jgi:hypothetical protein
MTSVPAMCRQAVRHACLLMQASWSPLSLLKCNGWISALQTPTKFWSQHSQQNIVGFIVRNTKKATNRGMALQRPCGQELIGPQFVCCTPVMLGQSIVDATEESLHEARSGVSPSLCGTLFRGPRVNHVCSVLEGLSIKTSFFEPLRKPTSKMNVWGRQLEEV